MSYKTLLLGIILLALLPIGGCASITEAIEQTTAWRDSAFASKAETETALADLIDQRASFKDGSQQADLIDAAIAQAKLKVAALDAAIVNADLVLAQATNPTDTLTKTTQLVLPFLPAPTQAPVLLGAALLATLVRSKQLKVGTQSIIQSIQHAINQDETFKAAFANNADTIRTIQTPLARKMVDQVQRV